MNHSRLPRVLVSPECLNDNVCDICTYVGGVHSEVFAYVWEGLVVI